MPYYVRGDKGKTKLERGIRAETKGSAETIKTILDGHGWTNLRIVFSQATF